MRATIGLQNLRIKCIIGELSHERELPQVILVDVKVEYDSSKCVGTDDVADAIDYVRIGDLCKKIAVEGKFRLVETYVCHALDAILSSFDCYSAWIKVCKTSGYPEAECATVEMIKERL